MKREERPAPGVGFPNGQEVAKSKNTGNFRSEQKPQPAAIQVVPEGGIEPPTKGL